MVTVLKGAKLFDGAGDNIIHDAVVVINDRGRIEQAGDSRNVHLPEGQAAVHDLKGKFILPGLIDAHVHLDMCGVADTYEENMVEDRLRAAGEMEKTLEAGFTTVRNAGSVNCIDFSVKDAVEQGLVKGPRILTSGKILSVTCSGTEYFSGLYRVGDGYDEFKKAAREQLKGGADLIKIMATGAVMNPGGVPGAEQPGIKEMEAAVEEAAKLGKRVAAHAHGARGIENAVRAGASTIEHGTFAGDETVKVMAGNNVSLVPTLAAGHFIIQYGLEAGVPRFMIEKAEEGRAHRINAVKKAIEHGVKIAMGTDAGTPYNYHGCNAAEIVIYVKEGLMTPGGAIKSATRYAAEACGLLGETGTIEQGKQADLIVVDGNPLENIELLADKNKISKVFKGGQLVKDLENNKGS